MASGELSKFECISPVELAAAIDALIQGFGAASQQPTAAGLGGSDQPTFGKRMMPVRAAASVPDPMAQSPPKPADASPRTSQDPGFAWRRKVAGPSAPDMWHGLPPPLPPGGGVFRGAPRPLPPPTTMWVPPQPAGINPGIMGPSQGWAGFERNARPSANIEDYRRTRGKPFIAQ